MDNNRDKRKRKPQFLRIGNYDNTQRFKEPGPTWIIVPTSLLDEYKFQQMPDETKGHAFLLMILASRTKNIFPNDEPWLRSRIGAHTKIDIDLLLSVGFLEPAEPPNTEVLLACISFNDIRKPGDTESGWGRERKAGKSRAHTQTESESTSVDVSGVRGSKFSIEDCLRYTKHCQSQGQKIQTPEGLAMRLHKTGDADPLIEAFLNPPATLPLGERKLQPPDPECNLCSGVGEVNGQICPCRLCPLCTGTGLQVVDGKGARHCPCRSKANGNSGSN